LSGGVNTMNKTPHEPTGFQTLTAFLLSFNARGELTAVRVDTRTAARHALGPHSREVTVTQVKDVLLQGVGKLMQSEQAMKLMQNEAVVKALTKAFTATTEARQAIDQRVASVVKSLKLATRDDLKTLRRNVERLERELTTLRRSVEENALVTSEAVETARIAARAADAARARAEATAAPAPRVEAGPSTKSASEAKSASKAKSVSKAKSAGKTKSASKA